MNTNTLTLTALRFNGLFLDIETAAIPYGSPISAPVLAFARRLAENGFCLSEQLLHALCLVPVNRLVEITSTINEVMGISLNWNPLVKNWTEPTGESLKDHIVTFIANIFGTAAGFRGTRLPCGHLIPEGTFPLERYNGCPFCGTPFQLSGAIRRGQGTKLRELRLFTVPDMEQLYHSLLASAVPLDATHTESLKALLQEFPVPAGIEIPVKETAMLVIRRLLELGRPEETVPLMRTPTDVLRFLWFEKTGHLQIIEPRTLVSLEIANNYGLPDLPRTQARRLALKERLKLRYDRSRCRIAAGWLNALPMTPLRAVEDMNPKRGMWVRFIRALRLGEYSRRPGFGHLAEILDLFYRDDYATWQGAVDSARSENDFRTLVSLLRRRPGLFARCLFSTMLRFGADPVLEAFDGIADRLPSRLLMSLANSAHLYFSGSRRPTQTITGHTFLLHPHPLTALYSPEELSAMARDVNECVLSSMRRRFAALPSAARTVFIHPGLFYIPVAVGDRSATVQDTSCALPGTRFPVSGDSVRLFLQWGKGLPAQHLDMDLSCAVAFADGHTEHCAYYSLTCTGARHSGDIQSIPEMVGTAEYIELSLPELEAAGAVYVTFTCNAYTAGALSPNLVVGWMDSAFPMVISETTGVAYDPSCVSHMVRISETNLAKGLVFGVLDVKARSIIWLEMPFRTRNLMGLDMTSVRSYVERLAAKISVGRLLSIRAEALGQTVVDDPDLAEEVFPAGFPMTSEASSVLFP